MKEKTATESNFRYIVKISLFLFMMVYAGVFIQDYFIEIFKNKNASIMPLVLWFFITWIVLCAILYFLYINIFEFTFSALLLGWITIFPAMLFSFLTGFYSTSLVEKNYVGLYWKEEINLPDSEPDEVTHKTFIFQKGDPKIPGEHDRIYQEYGFEPYEKDFIFWQTGYYMGHDPEHIIDSNTLISMDMGVVLGIYPIIECFSLSIKYFLFLIWIPILLLYFKGIKYDFKMD